MLFRLEIFLFFVIINIQKYTIVKKSIKTSDLVCVKDNKILLVRVRDNTIWYFPGGKIDDGETITSYYL